MKNEKNENATPESAPPPANFQWVWESLVPRLVGAVKIGIVEALIFHRKLAPLAPADLAQIFPPDMTLDLIRYHMKYLAEAGVLEVAGSAPRPDGVGEEPTYRLPSPPQSPGA